MELNIAYNFSSAAAVSPLAAPFGAISAMQIFGIQQNMEFIVLLSILSIGIAYAVMFIVVAPIFVFTRQFLELMSNLVYGLHDSGGLPADLSLVHSVDKPHAGDDIGELAEAA